VNFTCMTLPVGAVSLETTISAATARLTAETNPSKKRMALCFKDPPEARIHYNASNIDQE
jgi:hypothetical protein